MFTSTALLAAHQPGVIVGPIAKVLGLVFNAVYNLIDGLTTAGTIGFAIIAFTFIVKLVLMPLIFKQQKSTYAMQKIQPELDKIKKKYENKKDAESQQKMAYEMQKLQKDNNISMFGGCLPLLIQLPILYALFYIFQQPYLYVDTIGQNYDAIANTILSIPVELRMDVFGPFAAELVTGKNTLDLALIEDIKFVLAKLSNADWEVILASLPEYSAELTPLVESKIGLETFLTMSIIEGPGFRFPHIFVPVFAAGTTYLSSQIMMSKNKNSSNDENPMMQSMKMMNYMMPVMMGVFSFTMPAGLGIYWSISNIFQMLQTVFINKYYASKDRKKAA